MKKILFVLPNLRMGGAEKSLTSLLKAMDPTRYQVDLFLFEAGGPLQPEVPGWVNILPVDPVTRGMTLELRFYLKDLLKAGKWGCALSRVYMSLAAGLTRKLGRTPFFSWGLIRKRIPSLPGHYDVAVGYLEGFSDFFVMDKVEADKKIGWVHTDVSRRVFHPEETALYSRFDAMGTMSEICREAFCEKVPACRGKMQVIENIVLPQDVRDKAEQGEIAWPDHRWHLVSVGRLDRQKGYDLAIDACALLKQAGLDICWHVYGKGVLKEDLARQIADQGLQENFILEGMNPNPYPYMKKANLIVQTSRLEGKSIVLDEAKILGKAILVTNYPSVGDQITQGKTGWIVDMTPQAIAQGIAHLLENESLRIQLEQGCRESENESIRALGQVYGLIDD